MKSEKMVVTSIGMLGLEEKFGIFLAELNVMLESGVWILDDTKANAAIVALWDRDAVRCECSLMLRRGFTELLRVRRSRKSSVHHSILLHPLETVKRLYHKPVFFELKNIFLNWKNLDTNNLKFQTIIAIMLT